MVKNIETTWSPGKSAISRFLFLCAAGLLAAGFFNLIGGKISLSRLALFGAALLVSVGLGWLGRQTQKKEPEPAWMRYLRGQKTQIGLIALTGLLFMLGWYVIWTPLDNFGKFYYYLQGAFAFIVWMTCASGAALFLLFASRLGIHPRRWLESLRENRGAYLFSAVLLGIFGLLAVLASYRVVGMQPAEEGYWYGAGVPIVAFQVFASLILGIGLAFLLNKLSGRLTIKTALIDFLLFVLIWGVSAWLWAREPVKPEFLVTQPVAPNYELYPDYDARLYDVMSQFALIGQGINNHSFFDRVLYPAFLTYVHTLAGQDYSQVMSVQAGLFAIIPALLFLIGNSLYNRAGGLSLAILTTLRGVNAINIGNIINTSHQKQMLTEFPTAVLLVLATYLLIRWLQNPTKNWLMAGLAGTVIGLSTLLRPHTLMLIPVFFILAFFAYRHRTRLWLGICTLFLTAALCSVLPWVQFGGQNVSIFSLYFTRIQDVIRQRYPSLGNWGQTNLPGAETGSMHLAEIKLTGTFRYASQSPAPKSIWAFAADNFLNNLVTSVQFLPNTPFNLDAHTMVKKTDNYWKQYWDGSLTDWAKICILLNLALLALGFGTAWKRARWLGLLPLFILLTYYLADSFGRTSGGRYLVPADWVVPIYYVLGLFTVLEIITSLFTKRPEIAGSPQAIPLANTPVWLGAVSLLVVSLSLGATIPLAQSIHPLRYAAATPAQLADIFVSIAGSKLNLSADQLNSFLATKDAVILSGRSLYARQFTSGQGLDISVYNFYHSMPYPRTLFTLLGQSGENVIILPRQDAAKIPSASDVMVIGCRADGYITAWAVIRQDDKSIFERTPGPVPLACPLPDPICDANKSCHY